MNKIKVCAIGFEIDSDCSGLFQIDIDSLVYQIHCKNPDYNIIFSETFKNEYDVLYKGNIIYEYQTDYYPALKLKPNYNGGAEYSSNINNFMDYDYLIMIIDGTFFQGKTSEEIIKNLQRKCSRIINPYISEYSNNHHGYIMPITFAITKADTFCSQFDNNSVVNIISEAFNSIFTENVWRYIVCLNNEIKSGINIPMMIGIDKAFNSTTYKMQNSLESDREFLNAKISDQQGVIDMHNERILKFLSKGEAERAQGRINQLKKEITVKEQEYMQSDIWEQDKYFKSALARELKNNQNSLVFGFNNELQYEIIDRGKNETAVNDEPVLSVTAYIVVLIVLGIIGIWLPAVSCTLMTIIQLWYLIFECSLRRNLLTFSAHFIIFYMFAVSGYSDFLIKISFAVLGMGLIHKIFKFIKEYKNG